MIKDISHLPTDEKKHFQFCEYCENYFDMRDLSEVFLHAKSDCISAKGKPKVQFSAWQRVGDPEEFFKDKTRINRN
jgi:hypothetical protein